MVSRINDSRIGIRNNTNGRIVQFPSRYADGGHWNRQNNPAPTTVYFGPGMRFFYTLPVGKARIDTFTRQELERVVLSSLTEDDIAELNAPRVVPERQTQSQNTPVQNEPIVVQNERFQFSIGQPVPEALSTDSGGVVVRDNTSQVQGVQKSSNSLFEGILPNAEDN